MRSDVDGFLTIIYSDLPIVSPVLKDISKITYFITNLYWYKLQKHPRIIRFYAI